jgi:hypothetical protein
LNEYLAQTYRRDVLGESVAIEMPEVDRKLMLEIAAEIARIDGLRLGAHLANRDFVSYQNRRALMALRDQLRAQGGRDAVDADTSDN